MICIENAYGGRVALKLQDLVEFTQGTLLNQGDHRVKSVRIHISRGKGKEKVLLGLSREKISVQCSRGLRKSSKSVIIGVLKYYIDQVNQLDKFYRCYFSFLECTASGNSLSSAAHEERGCCHLK